MKDSIAIQDLPRTFQDAIEVARNLEIHYIWIDCLCIMQDSRTKWANEAGLMSKVYQEAYFNIAATFAMDSSEGLFAYRKLYDFLPFEVRSSIYEDVPSIYVIYDNIWIYHVRDAPLMQRAVSISYMLLVNYNTVACAPWVRLLGNLHAWLQSISAECMILDRSNTNWFKSE